MTDPYENLEPMGDPDVPTWNDEYIDRVSDRLMFNYDLEKDYRVRGRHFTLYGEMQMQSEKHFFHPALRFGHHELIEHVFVHRRDSTTISEQKKMVDLGHVLAEDWITPNEEHYGTEFTFVTTVDTLPDDVKGFIRDFRDRTLIKFGYFGRYDIHLIAVTPDREDIVSSRGSDLWKAFALWESPNEGTSLKGLLSRLLS